MDSKSINRAILKNKYRMQNIDCPMDSIAQTITDLLHNRGVLFPTIDLLFAYHQLPLDKNAVINAISTSKADKPLEHTDSIQVFTFQQACLLNSRKQETQH